MIAIMVCPFVTGIGPDLTMEQLGAVDGVKLPDGYGYCVIGQVPQAPTCLVRVVAAADTIAALSEDARYAFVEEIIEEVTADASEQG